jgi:hypothetical protein
MKLARLEDRAYSRVSRHHLQTSQQHEPGYIAATFEAATFGTHAEEL